MIRCPSCQEENPPKFRLCGYCGAALAAAAALPQRDVRRTVTLLFCDLKGSTALGERLDAEALHEVKERYFAAMARQITRHGGKIEKYIGDAIMAVFGLPLAHEDDALRAVRAAAGMQAELRRVNAELRERQAEHRHDRVPDVLLDLAAVARDLPRHRGEVALLDLVQRFGVEALAERGRALQVAEQQRHGTPHVALRQRRCRGQRGPAVAAQAELRRVLLLAARAADHAGVSGAGSAQRQYRRCAR